MLVAILRLPSMGRGPSEPATGETYHFEVGGAFYSPTPTLFITSEGLGIPATRSTSSRNSTSRTRPSSSCGSCSARSQAQAALRVRPDQYEKEATITRSIVFNGQRFNVSLPVLAELKWNAMRFTYEYDFVYQDRGFFGLVLDLKYTDVEAALTNALIGREFAHAQAPIPAIGGTGRYYVVPNISSPGVLVQAALSDMRTIRLRTTTSTCTAR